MVPAEYPQRLLDKLPADLFRGGITTCGKRRFSLVGKLLPAAIIDLDLAGVARLLNLTCGAALLGVGVRCQTAEKRHTQRDSTQSRG
ncbi:MAG: hypothetical protein HY661_12050 [Betaproteobacteria bacterium]|nr:hypothetical protein [Betaproteobacteria bacterium]